jgi:adenylate cyclase
MRISCTYRGKEKEWESSHSEVIIGRVEDRSGRSLDLTPDNGVSRLHARIWQANGCYWIEDLNSTGGTKLNGIEIKSQGQKEVQTGNVILAGQTTLRLVSLEDDSFLRKTNYLEFGENLVPREAQVPEKVDIGQRLDATIFSALPIEKASEMMLRRLQKITDIPLKFGAKLQLETLLPAIVEELVDIIPTGESWALVLREPGTDALLLKAYHHYKQPYLSETLARRAITERKAFIWRRTAETDVTGTIVQNSMATGMYAPLLWQGEALGVICAGAESFRSIYTEEDLRLATVVAQYAAMAVASHRLQETLAQETAAKAILMRQFSPKVAERLLSFRGRTRLGGQRNEVTILNSDIRGFTQLAHDMDADDVIDMLNEYFGVIVPVIFKHGGSIDKFIGDAILAVFGSPEPDPKQHEHALWAAVEMQAAIARLNESRNVRGSACRGFGIGIHCGEVVHGFVGTAERMEFTVISDAVNRAARYCSAAAEGEILISPQVHERVWRIIESERLTVHTKHGEQLEAYRVNSCKRIVSDQREKMDEAQHTARTEEKERGH